MNYPRDIYAVLESSLANDLCIVLVGAKQTGKTITVFCLVPVGQG